MNQFDLYSAVFVVGLSIPVTLYGVYWFAVDTAKRYVDKEIRKTT